MLVKTPTFSRPASTSRALRLAVPAMACLLAGLAGAGAASEPPQRMPTPAELAEARGQIRMPSAQELARTAAQLPRLPAGSAQPVDLRGLAEQHSAGVGLPGAFGPAQVRGQDEAQREPTSGPVVFVSLGMPEASLRRLVADAETAGALLVLRGLKERSLQTTVATIKGLMGERRVEWRVDPKLFDTFAVQAVPTLVLIDPSDPLAGGCRSDQCAPVRHARLAGDVPLRYALQEIAAADSNLRPVAERLLARFDAASFHKQGGRP